MSPNKLLKSVSPPSTNTQLFALDVKQKQNTTTRNQMLRKHFLVMQWVAWGCIILLVLTQRKNEARLGTSFSQDLEDAVSFAPPATATVRKLAHVAPNEERTINDVAAASSTQAPAPPARFIMGIFSVQDDHLKRKWIRQTLRMYNDSRVCAMGSVKGAMPPPPADECQLLYTFVIGAKPTGATQIVGGGATSLITDTFRKNMLRQQRRRRQPKEMQKRRLGNARFHEPKDMTFLNIKENMEDGKSPTWFNYASLVMNKHDLDYAIKIDSDTGLRVDRFFTFAQDNLPRGGKHIYSGRLLWDTWSNVSVPYMAGEFYILSRDLAQLASGQSVHSTHGILNIEDRDTGFLVWKLKPHLVSALFQGKNWLWQHHLKEVKAYRQFAGKEWERIQRYRYLQQLQKKRQQRQQRQRFGRVANSNPRDYNNEDEGDPPQGLWQSALNLFGLGGGTIISLEEDVDET